MSSLQTSDSPGYRLYSFPELGADADVLLPYELVDHLELEQIERETARREEFKRSLAVEEEQRIARERARASGTQLPPPPPPRPLSPLEAARALTVPGYVPQPSSDKIAVFDWGAAQKRFYALKNSPMTADKDLLARDLRHFAKAMAHGPWRSVARPEGWRDALTSLACWRRPEIEPVMRVVPK